MADLRFEIVFKPCGHRKVYERSLGCVEFCDECRAWLRYEVELRA